MTGRRRETDGKREREREKERERGGGRGRETEIEKREREGDRRTSTRFWLSLASLIHYIASDRPQDHEACMLRKTAAFVSIRCWHVVSSLSTIDLSRLEVHTKSCV